MEIRLEELMADLSKLLESSFQDVEDSLSIYQLHNTYKYNKIKVNRLHMKKNI